MEGRNRRRPRWFAHDAPRILMKTRCAHGVYNIIIIIIYNGELRADLYRIIYYYYYYHTCVYDDGVLVIWLVPYIYINYSCLKYIHILYIILYGRCTVCVLGMRFIHKNLSDSRTTPHTIIVSPCFHPPSYRQRRTAREPWESVAVAVAVRRRRVYNYYYYYWTDRAHDAPTLRPPTT